MSFSNWQNLGIRDWKEQVKENSLCAWSTIYLLDFTLLRFQVYCVHYCAQEPACNRSSWKFSDIFTWQKKFKFLPKLNNAFMCVHLDFQELFNILSHASLDLTFPEVQSFISDTADGPPHLTSGTAKAVKKDCFPSFDPLHPPFCAELALIWNLLPAPRSWMRITAVKTCREGSGSMGDFMGLWLTPVARFYELLCFYQREWHRFPGREREVWSKMNSPSQNLSSVRLVHAVWRDTLWIFREKYALCAWQALNISAVLQSSWS